MKNLMYGAIGFSFIVFALCAIAATYNYLKPKVRINYSMTEYEQTVANPEEAASILFQTIDTINSENIKQRRW